jgi:hypothetical protein
LYLFSENVVVANFNDISLQYHFDALAKEFIGTDSLKNIWGLEDAYPRIVSIALGRILIFLDSLEKYQKSNNKKDHNTALRNAINAYQFFYLIITTAPPMEGELCHRLAVSSSRPEPLV